MQAVALAPELAQEIKDLALTSREQQIVECILAGMSMDELSKALKVGKGTIRTHLRYIYRACGVNSKPELILYIMNRCFKLTAQ